MRKDSAPTDVVNPVEGDPIWEALTDFPITLTMSKLLNLVPRFRQAMEARLQTPHKTIPALFMEPHLGLTIVDHQNPAIKVLVHGTEIHGCVVCWPSPATNQTKGRAERSGQTRWERAEESVGPKA